MKPIFCVFLAGCLTAQNYPPISAVDCYYKGKEVMQYHVKYKEFNEKIARRTFANFADLLDPGKLYFTQEDLEPYLNPSPETVKVIVTQYNNKNYTSFTLFYAQMQGAIERHRTLLQEVGLIDPAVILAQGKCDLKSWAKTKEQLKCRLLYIKRLQLEAKERIRAEQGDMFFHRIQKRETAFEEGFVFNDAKKQEYHIHVLILKSLTLALDNHTCYFTPEEAKRFLVDVQQRLFGIGALLRDDLDGFTVTQIIEGGPSDRLDSIRVGDKILAVDNKPVVGFDLIDVVDLIRGPKGSKVVLTIVRHEKPEQEEVLDITIVRDELVLKETRLTHDTYPYGNGVIFRLGLHSFYQDESTSSTQDIVNIVEKVSGNKKIYGIILDLRSNGGGALTQAIGVTSLFIGKGVVTSIQSAKNTVEHLRNLSCNKPYDYPLMILINRASASASEIVALCLADYGRALIVGDESSYGKGTYQSFSFGGSNFQKVNPLGEYKVTGGLYYTVAGKSPQLVGVKSDVTVPGIYNYFEIGEKYTKFPLKNASIPPNFDDSLQDVHPLYRARMRKILQEGRQEPSAWISTQAPLLSKNVQARIAADSNYCAFLAQIKNPETMHPDPEEIGEEDVQLNESLNVMKEFIVLCGKK